MGWTDDPELLSTFRAEVEDRLASLREGLLALEAHPSPRQLVTSLFRDAHTVKGSARMLGLDATVDLAHRCEDLLGQLRDGRVGVRRDLVDLLLVAVEAVGRSLPGAERPVSEAQVGDVMTALESALRGADPVDVPRLGAGDPVATDDDEDDDGADHHTPTADKRSGEHVRVPARRVHGLLDMVGETDLDLRRLERQVGFTGDLVREHQQLVRILRAAMLRVPDLPSELSDTATALVALGDQLGAGVRDLRGRTEDASGRLARVRDGVMALAMVPVRRVVAGFPALVREVAAEGGKDVELRTEGADVELDVRVLDGVADALRHLVTNAVDHGCEDPATRASAGKPRRAVVTVSARQAGSAVVLEVRDDGGGIDLPAVRARALELGLLTEEAPEDGPAVVGAMFEPGFTTRTDVTTSSGRGVGLDVVRAAVEGLGGSVEVHTEAGVGTSFVLTLPVTLGVVRCLLVRCGDERYAVPLPGVLETLSLADAAVHDVAGATVVVRHGENVPLVDLGAALGVSAGEQPRVAVLARNSGETVAWAVDSVDGEREVVVKPLGDFLGLLPGTAGATIDGDGTLVLLVDLRDEVDPVTAPARQAVAVGAPGGGTGSGPAGESRARVLVVEDSIGVRELQRTILEAAGYAVVTAVDGLDGAARLQHTPVDLVLSDVEMPGMDGFTLTRTIRRTRGWENVPVVIMTSRGDDADKRAGLDAGADAYLLKSEFDQHALVETVRRLVGR